MSDPGQSSRDCRGKFSIEGLQLYLESKIDAIVQLQNERAKHADDRFIALDTSTEKALAAVEKQTAAAFAANKEAVLKTEEAQKLYNLNHNDLSRKMEAQAAESAKQQAAQAASFVGREKLDDVVKQFDGKIDLLKQAITTLQQIDAAVSGRREQTQEHRTQANWSAGQHLAVILAIVGWALAIVGLLWKTSKP